MSLASKVSDLLARHKRNAVPARRASESHSNTAKTEAFQPNLSPIRRNSEANISSSTIDESEEFDISFDSDGEPKKKPVAKKEIKKNNNDKKQAQTKAAAKAAAASVAEESDEIEIEVESDSEPPPRPAAKAQAQAQAQAKANKNNTASKNKKAAKAQEDEEVDISIEVSEDDEPVKPSKSSRVVHPVKPSGLKPERRRGSIGSQLEESILLDTQPSVSFEEDRRAKSGSEVEIEFSDDDGPPVPAATAALPPRPETRKPQLAPNQKTVPLLRAPSNTQSQSQSSFSNRSSSPPAGRFSSSSPAAEASDEYEEDYIEEVPDEVDGEPARPAQAGKSQQQLNEEAAAFEEETVGETTRDPVYCDPEGSTQIMVLDEGGNESYSEDFNQSALAHEEESPDPDLEAIREEVRRLQSEVHGHGSGGIDGLVEEEHTQEQEKPTSKLASPILQPHPPVAPLDSSAAHVHHSHSLAPAAAAAEPRERHQRHKQSHSRRRHHRHRSPSTSSSSSQSHSRSRSRSSSRSPSPPRRRRSRKSSKRGHGRRKIKKIIYYTESEDEDEEAAPASVPREHRSSRRPVCMEVSVQTDTTIPFTYHDPIGNEAALFSAAALPATYIPLKRQFPPSFPFADNSAKAPLLNDYLTWLAPAHADTRIEEPPHIKEEKKENKEEEKSEREQRRERRRERRAAREARADADDDADGAADAHEAVEKDVVVEDVDDEENKQTTQTNTQAQQAYTRPMQATYHTAPYPQAPAAYSSSFSQPSATQPFAPASAIHGQAASLNIPYYATPSVDPRFLYPVSSGLPASAVHAAFRAQLNSLASTLGSYRKSVEEEARVWGERQFGSAIKAATSIGAADPASSTYNSTGAQITRERAASFSSLSSASTAAAASELERIAEDRRKNAQQYTPAMTNGNRIYELGGLPKPLDYETALKRAMALRL